jgi:hypothetical protein
VIEVPRLDEHGRLVINPDALLAVTDKALATSPTPRMCKHQAVMKQVDQFLAAHNDLDALSNTDETRLEYLMGESHRTITAVEEEHRIVTEFFETITEAFDRHPECKDLGDLFDQHPEYFGQLSEQSLDRWCHRRGGAK